MKRYTDPSSLRKHVKNHTKEEQDHAKIARDSCSQGRSTDNSQEGWLDPDPVPNLAILCQPPVSCPPIGQPAALGYDVGGTVQYEQSIQIKRNDNFRRGLFGVWKQKTETEYDNITILLGMIHQPNSLDSVDGEPLPFDTIPVRFEPGIFYWNISL